MRCLFVFVFWLFSLAVYSQQNLDTIYGNPKSVREKVEFLNENKQNYVFMSGDGDYGHATIFAPKGIKSRFYLYWYNYHWVFYVNYYKEFLENGLPKNETWYNKDGSFKREYKYTYDENNNLIEEKEFYYNNEFWLTKFHYNSFNKPIAMSYYISDEPNDFVHWYFIRNKNNKIIETRIIDEEGDRPSIVYDLNHQGNVVKKSRKFIPNLRDLENKKSNFLDSLNTLHEYGYDKRGNKILELNYFEEEGSVYSKKTYKYNELNKLITYKVFFMPSDSTKFRITNYKYNENGLKVFQEKRSSVDKSFYSSQETFYNKSGFIVKSILLENNNTTTIAFKYKFDKKGNWIKITKIVNDEPLYVWSRKIKYY